MDTKVEMEKAQRRADRYRQLGCLDMANEIEKSLRNFWLIQIAEEKGHTSLEGEAGLYIKDSVRVATTSPIDLAKSPAMIDDVALAAGDRILVKDQADAEANGVYVFNGTDQALTLAEDGKFTHSDTFIFAGEGQTNKETAFIYVGKDGKTFVPFTNGVEVPEDQQKQSWMLWLQAIGSTNIFVHAVKDVIQPEFVGHGKTAEHIEKDGRKYTLKTGQLQKPFVMTVRVGGGDKQIAKWLNEFGLNGGKDKAKTNAMVTLQDVLHQRFIRQYALDGAWVKEAEWIKQDNEAKVAEIKLSLMFDCMQVHEFA